MAGGTGSSDVSPSSLKRERERCGLTQEQLARRIGANKTTVSRWERGEVNPGIHHRNRLCEALGVDLARLEELLGGPAAARSVPGRPWLPARARVAGPLAVVLVAAAIFALAGFTGRLRAQAVPPTAPTSSIACTAALPCSLQVEVGQDLCLDYAVRYGTVEIWPCWNGRNQHWFVERDGARFALRSQQAPGTCISAAQPGQQLELGPCTGPEVWWTETRNRDGSYLVRSTAEQGMCLTDSGGGTDLRTPVVLARCADRPEQRWIGLGGPPPSSQTSAAGVTQGVWAAAAPSAASADRPPR